MRYLFLDDIRLPNEVGNYINPMDLRKMYREENWIIVRNYNEFIGYIEKNGLPDVISLDHDLAEIHYNPSTWTESFKYTEKTGYDCAKFLVEYCISHKKELPLWFVHSMNPVGADNIKSLLKHYENTSY